MSWSDGSAGAIKALTKQADGSHTWAGVGSGVSTVEGVNPELLIVSRSDSTDSSPGDHATLILRRTGASGDDDFVNQFLTPGIIDFQQPHSDGTMLTLGRLSVEEDDVSATAVGWVKLMAHDGSGTDFEPGAYLWMNGNGDVDLTGESVGFNSGAISINATGSLNMRGNDITFQHVTSIFTKILHMTVGNFTAPRTVAFLDTSGTFATEVAAPSTASDSGVAGSIAYDSDFFYVCVDTDTWKRVALSTW